MIRSINVTRYIQPLREGGSLPALAEGDEEFFFGGGAGCEQESADDI